MNVHFENKKTINYDGFFILIPKLFFILFSRLIHLKILPAIVVGGLSLIKSVAMSSTKFGSIFSWIICLCINILKL